MKLTVKERLVLPDMLPKSNDLLTMMQVKDIKDKTVLSSAEIKAINPTSVPSPNGGMVTRWDEKKDPHKDIKLSDAEVRLLLSQVEQFDKEKKITEDMIPLIIKLKDYKPKGK